MLESNSSDKISYIGAISAIVLGLYLSSRYSYLLFHGVVEIITIAVAFTLFILTWNSRRYLTNGYLRLLGISYVFIALIDLIHTLAYKGMGVFPGYGTNLPTQLWIAARYLQAVTLFAAPMFAERRVNIGAIVGTYAVAVTVLVAMVFTGNFPDCFIEGKGLTTFKISSEYLISALLLASLHLFYRKRKCFTDTVFFLTASSVACTVLSEISFTAYVSAYGFANLVGHFSKLAAFYLIYRAILVTGLKEPFDLIFRELKQAEAALWKSQDTLEMKIRERTAELRASEERYRSLIQKVQTAILLHDGQGIILSSNPMAQELLGLSADRLSGKVLIDQDWHFLREDGSVSPVAEYPVSLVLSSNQPITGQVTGISRPGRDDVTWVLVNAEPEYDDAGKIVQVIVSFVDITERKLAEEALHRLNRELRAISNCNQLLVRAEDEQTLLNEICRIICDQAGYRMTWVGYAENDDARTVRPVAWARAEDGYLAAADITWADTERGCGPSGKAIRSGDSICIQDFATDPQASPWRDSALQRGYRSSIALPLKDESAQTFGVLNIYSTEPNAFTTNERRLLEELSGDLAFGIMVLRARIERKLAEEALRNSEAKYRRIVDTASEGICMFGPDYVTTFVNARIAEMLGYSCEEMIGRTGTEFLFEEDVPDHLIKMENHRQGLPERYDRRYRHKDGETVWALVSATPIFDDEHHFQGSLAMLTEITEKKLAEEELRRLKDDLEQRVRERTAELAAKNAELERMNRLFVGRELRMVELKKRILDLERVEK